MPEQRGVEAALCVVCRKRPGDGRGSARQKNQRIGVEDYVTAVVRAFGGDAADGVPVERALVQHQRKLRGERPHLHRPHPRVAAAAPDMGRTAPADAFVCARIVVVEGRKDAKIAAPEVKRRLRDVSEDVPLLQRVARQLPEHLGAEDAVVIDGDDPVALLAHSPERKLLRVAERRASPAVVSADLLHVRPYLAPTLESADPIHPVSVAVDDQRGKRAVRRVPRNGKTFVRARDIGPRRQRQRGGSDERCYGAYAHGIVQFHFRVLYQKW